VSDGVAIRAFQEADAPAVRNLFIAVNRELAPPAMHDAFEAYIARSLKEEIDRISDYYAEHDGGFWVALRASGVVGNFGLERVGPDAMELRRMYVAPAARRGGVAREMLRFAEAEARRFGARRLELSTSELQPAAVRLYRSAGYRLMHEATAAEPSNKTVGGGVRRYYFQKEL
jgi:putative acetyltransferase